MNLIDAELLVKKMKRQQEEELKGDDGATKRLKQTEEDKQEEERVPLYLEKLKLASFEALDELSERKDCPKCNQSRKYFCYDCYISLNSDPTKVPRLQLPISVTV